MRDSHLPDALQGRGERSIASTILPAPQGIRRYDPPSNLTSTGGSGLSLPPMGGPVWVSELSRGAGPDCGRPATI